MQLQLLDAIARAQRTFIADSDSRSAFDGLLNDLLALTASEYGFIGEVLRDPAGRPYLKTHALTNIAWNDATRAFYAEHAPRGLEFRNLDTLFGRVLTSGEAVISNAPGLDPRRGGLPEGHPALDAFLGIPIHVRDEMVAMAGIANRPGGYAPALIDALSPLLATIGQLVEARRINQGRAGMAEQLRESEARFRELAETVDVVFWIRTSDRMLYINPAYARVWGRSTRSLLEDPDSFIAAVHPDDRARVTEAFAREFSETGLFDEEYRILRPDGEVRWIHAISRPVRDEHGGMLRSAGTATDITERKRAEAALAENALHTQTILDNVLDAIITIDAQGRIHSFNQAAERIFGHTGAEVLGKNVSMLMPSPHHEQHDAYLSRYLATGEARVIGFGRELTGLRKNGEQFPLELAVSEINYQGRPLFIGMLRDITERKRVERMKNEFVSTVSHELRTPLTSIAGALGLLAGGALGELPAQAGEMIGVALRNSQRLTHLINDLLDMEKIAAGKLHFDMQPHDLASLVAQSVEANRSYAEPHGVHFVLDTPGDEVEVRIDGQRLMQVLSNLLSNAVKFSPPGGEVTVRLDTPAADRVRVSVRDRGPGIPDAFRDRLFEKFSQADSSDSRQKGGTGLGLAITKELVERMGGRIGYHSSPAGTTFHFDLPRGPMSPDALNADAAARDNAHPGPPPPSEEPA